MVNDRRTHREVIEDVCGCGDKNYCILKELILASGPDDRTLDQMKCIEMFKWEKGIGGSVGDERGWDKATQVWIAEGYADKFAKVYEQHHEHLKVRGMYNIIMGREPLEDR